MGSVNGLGFDQDRAAVVEGRMANPASAKEFVTTAAGAGAAGWHVGEVVPFGFYTASQINAPRFASGGVVPIVTVDAKLVGLVTLSEGVVQDDVDRFPTFALFTPALTRRLIDSDTAAFVFDYGLQLVHGSQDVPTVEREIVSALPPGSDVQPHLTADTSARTNRAIRPESIALGVFGLIAALAALAIAGQAIGRQLRERQHDLEVLRALGAGPTGTTSDALFGTLGAVILGALGAAGVTIALSPIGPIGPVRPVYPTRGIAFDWAVLGLGVGGVIVLLGTVAVVLAYRSAPHRVAGPRSGAPGRGVLANAAAKSGLPVPAVVGVRFALEPGGSGGAVPVRSAFVGTALAVIVVVATLTFGSGLHTLVSHPPLYGWNWTYALASETGPDVPPQAAALLGHDPDVAASSDATIADAQIDGQTVPVIFEAPGASVVPPILTGHVMRTNREVVLGAATIQELHTRVGGTVTVTYGSPKTAPFYVPPTTLRVVGTATLPAIGFPSTEGDHTSMGTGALVSSGIVPAALEKASQSPDRTLDGPEFVFVRMRANLAHAAALADIDRIADAGDKAFAQAPNGDGAGATVIVFADLLPAEIVNYRSMGATPAVLAGSLAAGAVVALALTLVSSVRRRRRDLALLKALGFTGAQVSAAVSVQATVVGIVGLVVGLPLGIALGRWLWVLFAHQIYAVPTPTVPVDGIVLVALAAMLLVNLVAVAPGRSAAHTLSSVVLRAE
ncbi:MAG TPA: FtsX-like permease family protein [Acidimicrobiales bacterium]